MTKASLHKNMLVYACPACGSHHAIAVQPGPQPGPVWEWNGSLETPTCSPSVRHRWPGADGREFQCHYFIKEGRLHYCTDSTHELAGKTLEIPPAED